MTVITKLWHRNRPTHVYQ